MPLEPTASTKGSQRPGEEMGKKLEMTPKVRRSAFGKVFFVDPLPNSIKWILPVIQTTAWRAGKYFPGQVPSQSVALQKAAAYKLWYFKRPLPKVH